MLHVTGERTLEKYKVFPYVAWALFIGFSLFVYSLVLELQSTAQAIANSNAASYQNIGERVQSNEDRIEALERAIGESPE
jgi:hypothetical protein